MHGRIPSIILCLETGFLPNETPMAYRLAVWCVLLFASACACASDPWHLVRTGQGLYDYALRATGDDTNSTDVHIGGIAERLVDAHSVYRRVAQLRAILTQLDTADAIMRTARGNILDLADAARAGLRRSEMRHLQTPRTDAQLLNCTTPPSLQEFIARVRTAAPNSTDEQTILDTFEQHAAAVVAYATQRGKCFALMLLGPGIDAALACGEGYIRGAEFGLAGESEVVLEDALVIDQQLIAIRDGLAPNATLIPLSIQRGSDLAVKLQQLAVGIQTRVTILVALVLDQADIADDEPMYPPLACFPWLGDVAGTAIVRGFAGLSASAPRLSDDVIRQWDPPQMLATWMVETPSVRAAVLDAVADHPTLPVATAMAWAQLAIGAANWTLLALPDAVGLSFSNDTWHIQTPRPSPWSIHWIAHGTPDMPLDARVEVVCGPYRFTRHITGGAGAEGRFVCRVAPAFQVRVHQCGGLGFDVFVY